MNKRPDTPATTTADTSVERHAQRALYNTERVKSTLRRRHAAERRFRLYGVIAIAASLSFLALLLTSIVIKGHTFG